MSYSFIYLILPANRQLMLRFYIQYNSTRCQMSDFQDIVNNLLKDGERALWDGVDMGVQICYTSS